MEHLKTYHFPVRIYYEDTDAGGIVYNANYLKYFERARTEWFRELGIHQSLLLTQEIGFVVSKVNMHNVAPAKLDDNLLVESNISKVKGASLVFQQKILGEQKNIICTAEILIVCVSLAKETPKPCPFPKAILGALSSVC